MLIRKFDNYPPDNGRKQEVIVFTTDLASLILDEQA